MRAAFAAVLAGSLAAGCLPAPEHRCAGDGDCAGGVCVTPPSACAFPDGTCAGGLRFGEGAGALASACVALPIDAAMIDAPEIDAPPPPDEDGDGVADLDDNCPHVANPLQEDLREDAAGGDGVGDACDPEPTRPGNSLAFFEGFNGPLASWMTDGPVTPGTGLVRLGAMARLTTDRLMPRHVHVVMGGRATGSFEQVGVVLGSVGASDLRGLTVTQTGGSGPRLRLAYGGNNAQDTASVAIRGTDRFTLSLTGARTQWTGSLTIGDAQPITVRRFSVQSLAAALVMIESDTTSFDVEYVAVIAMSEQ